MTSSATLTACFLHNGICCFTVEFTVRFLGALLLKDEIQSRTGVSPPITLRDVDSHLVAPDQIPSQMTAFEIEVTHDL